ncbi:hypothetical protein P7H17_14310 [Paenibacillus larvae]|nr:hypothetical protein [Paenibacillus larvae]MDT2286968.1 hypothetical protein [Paenibacillus larvae]MDT2294292.1 hypothetical protein [Paenibacillus larvae]
MKTYSIVVIAISLIAIMVVFVLKLIGALIGKIILAVAVAFLITSLFRLISLSKESISW